MNEPKKKPKPKQFEMFGDGDAAKREGFEKVSKTMGDYKTKAVRLCILYCRQNAGTQVMGETLRHYVTPVIGAPPYNGWGPVIDRVIQLGGLLPTNKFAKPRDKASHSSQKRVYICQSV